MPNYGAWTGFGEGLAQIGQDLRARGAANLADREKQADRYESDARDIAKNIAQMGGPQAPGAQDLVQQLHRTVTMHNALYPPHETPALIARIGKFLGHQPGPPREDPRASLTEQGLIAGAPRPAAAQDMQARFQSMVSLLTQNGVPLPEAQKRALDQLIAPGTSRSISPEYEERRYLQDIIANGTPAQQTAAKARMAEMDRKDENWSPAAPPLQVTAQNLAFIQARGLPDAKVGDWVQRQMDRAGNDRFRATLPDAAATGGLTPRWRGDELEGIEDANKVMWYSDDKGNFVTTDANGNLQQAPPNVQALGKFQLDLVKKKQDAKDEAAAGKEQAAAEKKARDDAVARQTHFDEKDYDNYAADLKKMEDEITSLTSLWGDIKQASLDQATTLVQASDFGKKYPKALANSLTTSWNPFDSGPKLRSETARTQLLNSINDKIGDAQDRADGLRKNMKDLRDKPGALGPATPFSRTTQPSAAPTPEELRDMLRGMIHK